NASVLIPAGRTVSLDGVRSTALRAIRVDGRLQFATDRDTGLIVDTMVVSPSGELVIGAPDRPIATGKQARITFADSGPIDTERDPNLLSRGLIALGAVTLCGAEVTPYAALARPPCKGDAKLLLSRPPAGWRKGDRLILTGTSIRQNQDEALRILDLSGTE